MLNALRPQLPKRVYVHGAPQFGKFMSFATTLLQIAFTVLTPEGPGPHEPGPKVCPGGGAPLLYFEFQACSLLRKYNISSTVELSAYQ